MVYQTMSVGRAGSQAKTGRAEAAAGQELGPLPAYVGYALRRAQSASFRHLERSAADLALTPGQFSQLSAIEANPGIKQGRLAGLFGLDKSTLSPAIDALARRGLVRRDRDEEDGRAWCLSLTPQGRQTLARMRARVEAQERLIDAALTPAERARLIDTLRRVEAALDAA